MEGMASGKGRDKEKNIAFGKDWDPENMLGLYIYDYMKKKGLHDVADIFCKEADLETFKLMDSDKGLLKEWWQLFWPQFSSRLANKAGENSQSLTQPSVQDVQLASLEKQATSSQHPPVGNPQHDVIPTPVTNQLMIASGGSAVANVMKQPSASLAQTPPIISQQRAGKRAVDADTDNILGKSSTQAIRKGTHGFPPVKLLPTQLPFYAYTTLPPSRSPSPSNLHLPVTMQSPVQITGDPRNDVVAEKSNQMESQSSWRKFLKK